MKNLGVIIELSDSFKRGNNVKSEYDILKSEVIEVLEVASDMYYNSDKKLIDDQTYDNIVDMHKAYGGKTKVGASPRKGEVDVDHDYKHLVGTLSKVNTIDEMKEWLISTFEGREIDILVTQKFDGNSIVCEYNNGKLVKALTRGRDGKGMDLTKAILANDNISTINYKGKIGIKYEVIMTYENFDRFMNEQGERYANPRSVVAGILGRDDAYLFTKYLDAVPLWIDCKDVTTRKGEIEMIESIFPNNLNTTSDICCYNITGNVKGVVEELEKIYKKIHLDRMNNKLDYMIDGLVIEVFNDDLRKSLGYVNDDMDIPKFAVALKFPYMEKTSEVTHIEFWMSENGTGRVTPMCFFKTVEFNGTKHFKQSLQNYKRFKELNLGVGSPILVQYRNDVLTYIEPLETDKNIKPIEFIDECPICGEDLYVNDNGTFVTCENDYCSSRICGSIVNYITKMDMKGIGESTIRSIYEKGLIKSIEDLYKLKENDITPIIGPTNAKNFLDILNRRKDVFDYEVLGSLRIESFSISSAKKLFKIMTLNEFMSYYNDGSLRNRLLDVEGISEITADYIIMKVNVLKHTINSLISILNIKSYKDTIKTVDKVLSFCVTGSVNEFKNRKELSKWIESKGHKVVSGVTKNTDYLINNDVNSNSGKNKTAKELNKPIINEKELIQMLD